MRPQDDDGQGDDRANEQRPHEKAAPDEEIDDRLEGIGGFSKIECGHRLAKIVKDSSIVKRPSGSAASRSSGMGGNFVSWIERSAMLAEASLAVFSVIRKFSTLPSARISKVTAVVPMLIRSILAVDVVIPARADRVLEQFLITSLRRADRIHGRAPAIVDPAADDRFLLKILVAGGRRWRRLVRRAASGSAFPSAWESRCSLPSRRGGDGRRSLSEEGELIWRWGRCGGRRRRSGVSLGVGCFSGGGVGDGFGCGAAPLFARE